MAQAVGAEETLLLPPLPGPFDLSVVVAFPNTYYVGMSSLSLQAVYGLLAEIGGVRVERAFVPKQGEKCAALESGTPLRGFDVVAFSLSFEQDYLNLLAMLDDGGVPLLAAARTESDPLVIAGGTAVSANPVPLADFVDAFLIGEAEEALPHVVAAIRASQCRRESLSALAAVEGMWVPRLNPEGPVRRLAVADLDSFETASVFLTPDTEFRHCFLVEVGRGCGRGCRFCLVGHTYRPLRQRSVASLVRTATRGLAHTDRIGLLGAALSDFDHIDELASELVGRGARLSTSSLRLESLSPTLAQALAHRSQRQVTLAPEAASERLRGLIGKPTSDEQLFGAVETALTAGLSAVKLYFMISLPTETQDEALAIAGLVARLERAFPAARFSVSFAPFVPKPHTPFQWAQMAPQPVLEARTRTLKAALAGHTHASVASESARWAVVQAILSRGGAELGKVLLDCHRNGATSGAFKRALKAHDLEVGPYLAPREDCAAALPWDFIEGAESKTALWRQWRRAVEGQRSDQERAKPATAADPCSGGE